MSERDLNKPDPDFEAARVLARKAIYEDGRGMIGANRNYLEYRVARAILAERREQATTIARLSEALAEAEQKGAEVERAMRDVITQADCLRHYARIEDNRQYKILETVGEIQAGHFEDIAVRLFPSLQTYLDQKRAERAPPRDLSQGGQHG
ncbi:hypothetical protein ACP4J4_10340 [Aureimonas ureilytica]|uniref:hypothetical protein n=1 Tax=Aureimonas ureilytica TaxID=401562 RepID=UPI003CE9B4ED